MRIRTVDGVLAVVGDTIDAAAQRFLELEAFARSKVVPRTAGFCVVLATAQEASGVSGDLLRRMEAADVGRLFPLGLALHGDSAAFVPCIWPTGQRLRRLAGLPPADFRIVLSVGCADGITQSVDALVPGTFPDPAPAQLLYDLSTELFNAGKLADSAKYARILCHTEPASPQGWFRLAEVSSRMGLHKLAMLSYARVLVRVRSNSRTELDQDVDPKIVDLVLQGLFRAANHAEWGVVATAAEADEMADDDLANELLVAWPLALRRLVARTSKTARTLAFEPRTRLVVLPHTSAARLPRFFSWVVPFHLAASSEPNCESDIDLLERAGVRHIVTLTDERRLSPAWFSGKRISNTYMPVTNYGPPTPEQMDHFLRLASSPETTPLLVHCGGGKGRAGTMLAGYTAMFGFCVPDLAGWDAPAMDAREAIAAIRTLRPGSIETEAQEQAVSALIARVWSRSARSGLAPFPEQVVEPTHTTLEIVGDLDLGKADLLLLVGLPGSGRAAVLDRTNGVAQDRKSFLALATWARHPVAIFFDFDQALCVQRALQRTDHPTVAQDGRVAGIVRHHADRRMPPTLDEGFRAVARVTSRAAIEQLVQALAPVADMFKFPRTSHVVNLGAATSDDIINHNALIVPDPTARVVLTEKVDGANLGFSLAIVGGVPQLRVQNRGKFVGSHSHVQFRNLGCFLDDHGAELVEVLGSDPYYPQRFVLFGEWLALRHSIPYSRLPSRFLAFDLYDRKRECFVDRPTLLCMLGDTRIDVVPELAQQIIGRVPTDRELIEMTECTSAFYDGPVEGVYIKIEHNGRVESRGKVVRTDFVAGCDTHWTKRAPEANGFAKFNKC
nr:hypothetical protein HK105_006032 [Polyrhizophydium stewartii]